MIEKEIVKVPGGALDQVPYSLRLTVGWGCNVKPFNTMHMDIVLLTGWRSLIPTFSLNKGNDSLWETMSKVQTEFIQQ